MRALIDTDILLDVALNRAAFVAESAQVLRWSEQSGQGAIAWHSLTNCSYLLKQDGRGFLNNLLKVVQVVNVGHKHAAYALKLKMPDLEDAFQVAAAKAWDAECIVTRNLKHYKHSPIEALSPREFNLRVIKN